MEGTPACRKPALGVRMAIVTVSFALFALSSFAHATGPSCLLPATGAPTCSPPESGNAPTPKGSAVHVGNPIEVTGGNKYQRESDYHALGSPLSWTRHYNSGHADRDAGLGVGWRHGWQMEPFRLTDGRLMILQGDGREVVFRPIPGATSPKVFVGEHRGDGIVTLSPHPRWYLSDGSEVEFRGRYPVRWVDAAGQGMDFSYEGHRLVALQDRLGRRIEIDYVEASDGLPDYGRDVGVKYQGAIERVILPDGSSVNYRYAERRTLTNVRHGERMIDYGYANPEWRGHLTSRTEGAITARWRYDEHGRAVGWRSRDGATELTVERKFENPSVNDRARRTITRFTDGRTVETSPLTKSPASPDPSMPPVSDPVSADDPVPIDTAPVAWDALLDPAFVAMVRSMRASLEPIGGTNGLRATVDLAGQRVEMRLHADAQGRVIDIGFGQVSLARLQAGAGLGTLEPCAPAGRGGPGAWAVRLVELAGGAAPCSKDLLLLAGVAGAVQRALEQDETTRDAALRKAPRRAPHYPRPPPPPPPDPFCTMPAGRDCAQLRHDYRMAELADCAYLSNPCAHDAQRVDPATIGLSDNDFHDAGFDAELYYEPDTDVYTLVFRGTDGVGDDWSVNGIQGIGMSTRQYELAIALALRLQGTLPTETIEVAGHSLGGGLATHAALFLQAEATVFNPAALHGDTAAAEGLEQEYAQAAAHVDVVRVEGDPISGLNGNGFLNVTGAAFPAPGSHTVLALPDDEWVQGRPNRQWWDPLDDVMIAHSMAAVIESLGSYLDKLCGGRG